MHSEFTIDVETEKKHRAGCVWNVLSADATREEVEENANEYGIDYETALKWKDYWLDLYKKVIITNNFKTYYYGNGTNWIFGNVFRLNIYCNRYCVVCVLYCTLLHGLGNV